MNTLLFEARPRRSSSSSTSTPAPDAAATQPTQQGFSSSSLSGSTAGKVRAGSSASSGVRSKHTATASASSTSSSSSSTAAGVGTRGADVASARVPLKTGRDTAYLLEAAKAAEDEVRRHAGRKRGMARAEAILSRMEKRVETELAAASTAAPMHPPGQELLALQALSSSLEAQLGAFEAKAVSQLSRLQARVIQLDRVQAQLSAKVAKKKEGNAAETKLKALTSEHARYRSEVENKTGVLAGALRQLQGICHTLKEEQESQKAVFAKEVGKKDQLLRAAREELLRLKGMRRVAPGKGGGAGAGRAKAQDRPLHHKQGKTTPSKKTGGVVVVGQARPALEPLDSKAPRGRGRGRKGEQENVHAQEVDA